MSFFRDAAGVLGTSIASAGMGLVLSIVLARCLTVEDRGLYGVLMALATVLEMVSRLGMPSASIYRLRIGSPVARVVGTGLFVVLAGAGTIAAIAAVFQPVLSRRLLDDAPGHLVHLALVCVPVIALNSLLVSVARGVGRFALSNLCTFLTNAFTLVATTAVLLVPPGGVVMTLLAYLGARVVVTGVFGVLLLRDTGVGRPDAGEARASLRYGLKSYAQLVAGQVHERIDVFMIAALLNEPQLVAFYAVAVGVIDRLKLIPEAAAAALFPRIAGLTPKDAALRAADVARHSLAWIALGVVALGAVAPWLVPLLYGEPYRASVTPFLIMLPAMAGHTLYKVLARYFMAVDRQQVPFVTEVISGSINVGLNLWWIPTMGIAGAALASLVSYVIEAFLIVFCFLIQSGVGVAALLRFRRADVMVYRSRVHGLARRLRGGRRADASGPGS